MNDIIKIIETNKKLIILVIACLMFIFFGCCSAIDIAGKAQAGGLKVVFNGEGMGFSRLISVLILIIPLIIAVGSFVDLKLSGILKEHFNTICFLAAFILCILLAIVLPKHITLAWGSWLYIILSLGGAAVSCSEYIKK